MSRKWGYVGGVQEGAGIGNVGDGFLSLQLSDGNLGVRPAFTPLRYRGYRRRAEIQVDLERINLPQDQKMFAVGGHVHGGGSPAKQQRSGQRLFEVQRDYPAQRNVKSSAGAEASSTSPQFFFAPSPQRDVTCLNEANPYVSLRSAVSSSGSETGDGTRAILAWNSQGASNRDAKACSDDN